MDESSLKVSAKDIVPSLKIPRARGKNGFVAVFGDHRGYIGSTYFTGEGALRVDADVVYIFTTKKGEEVRILSPNFIVYHIIHDVNFIEESVQWFGRMDTVVIGPGFFRHSKSYHLFGDFLAGVVGTFFGFTVKHPLIENVTKADLVLTVCQGASKLVVQIRQGHAHFRYEEISDALKELFKED